ncbi:MAG: Fe-S cluster assembly protein SufD [Bacteroidota bacterium]
MQQAQQAVHRHVHALGATHPLYPMKQQAWQRLQQLGFPTAQNEAYKYTPITTVLPDAPDLYPSPPNACSKLTKQDLLPYLRPKNDGYQLVFVNGQLRKDLMDLEDAQLPWDYLTLQEAYLQNPTAFTPYAAQATDPFVALNTALCTEGTVIRIPDHTVLDQPLYIHHITDACSYPRLHVWMGKNSHAQLVMDWQTLGTHPQFTNALTAITLDTGAQLQYYTLQTRMQQAHQIHTAQCYQASHSVLHTHYFTWGGNLVRNNLHTYLQGPHAEAYMYGLYSPNAYQHVDNHTRVDHQAPNTQSHELYKGIIGDHATGIFNGGIGVQPAAQKTRAFQSNHNMLMTDQATLHTKPQLEIYADDVKCSHGATIGQLDEAQLFYLRARGIPMSTARHMLLYAFVKDIVNAVNLPALWEQLDQDLQAVLATFELDTASA